MKIRETWPRWIGHATAAASLGYGALGVVWALGGPGFPFGRGDAELVAAGENGLAASLLGAATARVGGPVIALTGVLGACAALAMARGWGRDRGQTWRRLLTGFGLVTAVVLAVLIPDYRVLVVVAYTPILAVTLPFGFPAGQSYLDLVSWPRINLILLVALGIAWAATTVAYRRRTSGTCGNCGRGSDGTATWTTAASAARWGRWATWIAFATPFVYAATRWAWALGIPLGITDEFLREGEENGMWIAGATLATMGAGGAVLTLGLIQGWGEVFPRWMPGLRGRRVPISLATVPAALVAILVTEAGLMYVRMVALQGVTADSWATTLPETVWPVWGVALGAAALAYHLRRRGGCRHCGAGVPHREEVGPGSAGLTLRTPGTTD
ncbi:hypothetical protein AB0M43_02545 [Longispora sp. NPDC051575]|uniref:hypothetical protein n=1 Tax=Longispora sp. NPDC051575 TaxID=3154943 RepID=UPI00342D8096